MEENEFLISLVSLAFVLLGVGVFSVLLFFLFKRKELRNREEIEKINRAMLTSEIEVQERTLKNISAELHDNIGQSLALASLNVNSIDPDKSNTFKIEQTKELLQDVLSAIRDIGKSIKGDKVLAEGLVNSIKRELRIIENTGKYSVQFISDEDTFELEDTRLIITFRIVQEVLQNILKHSMATTITCNVMHLPTGIQLTIADNGIGFNVPDAMFSDGSGLNNMSERANLIKGHFKIQSTIDTGTVVTLFVPK